MDPTLVMTISAAFDISGRLEHVGPCGNGHINDSYLATYTERGVARRYVHQRINDRVFTDPPAVMQNIQRVTEHLHRKLAAAGHADAARRTLTVVPTRAGQAFLRAADGAYWRTYRFVDATHTYQKLDEPERAFQAARAFGRFQLLLADLPGPPLVETIRRFHDTPARYAAFEGTLAAAAAERRRNAEEAIAFAIEHVALAHSLTDPRVRAQLPLRITHNDTKLNNVLFDDATGEALCVVDLDTVMPGLSLYDFGDMVRTMTCPAAEDEPDLARVSVQLPMFEAVVRGYLESAGSMLTATERACLLPAALTIIFEQGLRFLTDHLAGDTYYKVHRPGHNLDRCRTQFKLIESMLDCTPELNAAVHAALAAAHLPPAA